MTSPRHKHVWVYALYATSPPYEVRRCMCGASQERIAGEEIRGTTIKPGRWRKGRSHHRSTL